MLRKSVGQPGTEAAPAASPTTTRLGVFKEIISHLTTTRYDDGSPREVGWLTIRTRGGQWEVVVKDPDSAGSLSAAAAKLDDALVLIDQLLGTPTAPWQPDVFLQARKPKKRA